MDSTGLITYKQKNNFHSYLFIIINVMIIIPATISMIIIGITCIGITGKTHSWCLDNNYSTFFVIEGVIIFLTSSIT